MTQSINSWYSAAKVVAIGLTLITGAGSREAATAAYPYIDAAHRASSRYCEKCLSRVPAICELKSEVVYGGVAARG